ncbi:MAG: hypothetical protein IKJ98_09140 [Bacteroidales bacterium]|nr:hypothetical protein [Bacteroidales bacterium]
MGRDAINRVSTNKIFLCREFLVRLDSLFGWICNPAAVHGGNYIPV